MSVRAIITCKSCGKETQVHARWLCKTCYQQHGRKGTLESFPTSGIPNRRGPARAQIGDWHYTGGGYVEVMTEAGWKKEHRVVMEGMIGRDLLPEESVHHKNGIRDDNRPENLELWHGKGARPKGARVRDLIEFVVDNHLDDVVAAIGARVR